MEKYADIIPRFPRLPATFLLMCFMTGCAGTHVRGEQFAEATAVLPQPHRIAIAVIDKTSPPHRAKRRDAHQNDVEIAERELTRDLTQVLESRHLAVVDQNTHADMVLQCAITNVRGGSMIARLLVGYGAGKATLNTVTTLSPMITPAQPVLTFDTRSTTGAMPGAGLGIMSAAGAAGTAVHMIGPLMGVPGTLKQGLAQEAQQTTDRIDDEMAKLFAERGWPYPRPQVSLLNKLEQAP